MVFGAVLHVVLVRFSKDEAVVRDLVQLNGTGVVGTEEQKDPLALPRGALWGMLYADDVGVVSKSAEGLAKMMTVIVTVLEAAGLTVSEKKTRDNFSTSTRPDNPHPAARHRSSRPEV